VLTLAEDCLFVSLSQEFLMSDHRPTLGITFALQPGFPDVDLLVIPCFFGVAAVFLPHLRSIVETLGRTRHQDCGSR